MQLIRQFIVTVLVSTVFLSVQADQPDSHNVFGTFLNGEKTAHIEISQCGDQSLCGNIIWLNPDKLAPGISPQTAKTKSGDAVLGLLILKDFKRKKNDWRGGTIYDPGKDKLYASRLSRLNNGDLEVKGCIAFFCQTQIWTPVAP